MAGLDSVAEFLSLQQQLATRGQRLDFTMDTLHTLCQVSIVIVTPCAGRDNLSWHLIFITRICLFLHIVSLCTVLSCFSHMLTVQNV